MICCYTMAESTQIHSVIYNKTKLFIRLDFIFKFGIGFRYAKITTAKNKKFFLKSLHSFQVDAIRNASQWLSGIVGKNNAQSCNPLKSIIAHLYIESVKFPFTPFPFGYQPLNGIS